MGSQAKASSARFVQSEFSIELACAEEGEDGDCVIGGLDESAALDSLLSLDDLHREPLAASVSVPPGLVSARPDKLSCFILPGSQGDSDLFSPWRRAPSPPDRSG